MIPPRAGLSALLTGLLLLSLPILSRPNTTPDCADSEAWDEVVHGAEGIYATVWGDSGVVGCQGIRGRMDSSGVKMVWTALQDALDEAGPRKAARVTMAKISILSQGRSVPVDATFDVSMESLLVTRGESSVVILRGEARTPSYAWRRARNRLGVSRAALVSGRVFRTQYYMVESDALNRWRNACRPAPGLR